MYITNDSTILKPDTVILKGILKNAPVQKHKSFEPDLENVPILSDNFSTDANGLYENPYTDLTKPVRNSSMPDSVWKAAVANYNNIVTARAALTDSANAKIISDAKALQDAADQQAAANAKAVSDANIAAQVRATEEATIAAQPPLDVVTKAMQTVFTTMDAADTHEATGTQPYSGEYADTNSAAGVQAQLDAQNNYNAYLAKQVTLKTAVVIAVNNAAAVGAILPVGMQTEAANNAFNVIDKAQSAGVDIPQVIALPDLNSNHLALADGNVITQDKLADVIVQVAADGAATDKAAVANPKDTTDITSTSVAKLGWFDRIVNYVYNNIY